MTLKEFAKNKTPERLKNPSDLQVRFRTAVVYTIITIGCIFLGDIPMVLMLSATAGIAAGEFYYMLRSDAKLPNEAVGIAAAVLYPISALVLGLTGMTIVTMVLLLALLVWYVFWGRARVADVGVSFFPFDFLSSLEAPILISSRTSFLMVSGVMPCSSLYAACFFRRRLVSSMAFFIDRVTVSAYIMTLPCSFRAARPIVCIKERSARKNPSLSASRMATSDTSGRSSPSRSRFIPTRTSKTPSRRSRMISILSMVSTLKWI